MKLSDLVKMANGADPEILVYSEDAEFWFVLPTSAVLKERTIVLVPDVRPEYDWRGETQNPVNGKPGLIGPIFPINGKI